MNSLPHGCSRDADGCRHRRSAAGPSYARSVVSLVARAAPCANWFAGPEPAGHSAPIHVVDCVSYHDKMWLYYNFFQPVMRMVEKTVIREQGQSTRTKGRHDDATTPLDRLCATEAIAKEQKDRLHALRDRTNPRQLRNEIHELIGQLFALPCAAPSFTENVYDTLTYRIDDAQDGYSPTMQLPAPLASIKNP